MKYVNDNFSEYGSKQVGKFVKEGAKTKTMQQRNEEMQQNLIDQLCEIDPFIRADKDHIKKLIQLEERNEFYNFEKDYAGPSPQIRFDKQLSEDVFNKLAEQRLQRIMIEDAKKKKETVSTNLREHRNFIESTYHDKQDKY